MGRTLIISFGHCFAHLPTKVLPPEDMRWSHCLCRAYRVTHQQTRPFKKGRTKKIARAYEKFKIQVVRRSKSSFLGAALGTKWARCPKMKMESAHTLADSIAMTGGDDYECLCDNIPTVVLFCKISALPSCLQATPHFP